MSHFAAKGNRKIQGPHHPDCLTEKKRSFSCVKSLGQRLRRQQREVPIFSCAILLQGKKCRPYIGATKKKHKSRKPPPEKKIHRLRHFREPFCCQKNSEKSGPVSPWLQCGKNRSFSYVNSLGQRRRRQQREVVFIIPRRGPTKGIPRKPLGPGLGPGALLGVEWGGDQNPEGAHGSREERRPVERRPHPGQRLGRPHRDGVGCDRRTIANRAKTSTCGTSCAGPPGVLNQAL